MKRAILLLVILSSLGLTPALADAGAISGTVTSSVDGVPLAGICVEASGSPYTGASYGYAMTGADGRYSMPVNPGRYRVSFWDCDEVAPYYFYETYDDGQDPLGPGAVIVTPLGIDGIDAALDPEARIEGVVTDALGAPLQGVCVYTSGPDFDSFARTDGQGRYTLTRVLGGAHKVYFRGDCIGRFRSEYYDDALSWDDATPVGVVPGEVKTGIDASLDREPDTGTGYEGIRGRVTGQGGWALSATIDVYRRGTSGAYDAVRTLETAEDGRFFIDEAPGVYKLYVRASYEDLAGEWFDDADSLETATPIDVAPGEIEVANVVLRPWPDGDVAIDIAEIENVPARTDNGPLPVQPGTRRRIHVDITNLSAVPAFTEGGSVVVCPETAGDCEQLESWLSFSLQPGETRRVSTDWAAVGYAGDVRITAHRGWAFFINDRNWRNDYDSASHYVVAGGVGVGVGRQLP